MNYRPLLSVFLLAGFLSSCQTSPKALPGSGEVPKAARPEDVAAADAFFAANKSRGMIPDAVNTPQFSPQDSAYVVELDQQRVYLYHQNKLVAFSKLASGRANHRTETGTYVIGQKVLNHRSNLYGDYVNASGGTMMKDVTQGFDPKPVGGRFQGSLMKHFQRFHTPAGRMTAMGFHTGVLPGYPASHGCVRLPDSMANGVFTKVPAGVPVYVRGEKFGVPMGTVQKRAKRSPKIHPSLKQTTPTAPPAAEPAGAEASPAPAAAETPAPAPAAPPEAAPAPTPAPAAQ
jgi:hypothetical protein